MVLSSCFVTVFGRCNVYLRYAYIVTYIYVFVKLHTQRNNVFIRFYFLPVWACPIGHTARPPAPPHPGRSSRRGLSGIGCRPVQRVHVRAYGLALHLARPALLPVMCGRSGCAGVDSGTPAGYIAAAQPRPVSPVTTEKIKKAQKTTPTPYCQSQKFPAKTKRPLQRVCVLCYTCLTSLEREESVK